MVKKQKNLKAPAPIRRSGTSDFTLSRSMKRRWVKALRSGKYKQGCGRLHDIRNNSFCCLGVLCDLLGADRGKMHEASLPEDLGWFKNVDFSVVVSRDGAYGTLAGLNDKGVSFKRIATLIEKCVPTHD